MARAIAIVNATQVVTSAQNPQGVYSNVSGYPIQRDSRDYERTEANPNGNSETAVIVVRNAGAEALPPVMRLRWWFVLRGV